MSKEEFLIELCKKLQGLPKKDVEERLTFYSEVIDDRIDDGYSEEEAVEAIGDINEIVTQIIEEIPLVKLAKERIRPKRKLTGIEITLLVIGSPLWLALVIACAAVMFALYVSLWSIIVSAWAVFLAFIISGIGSIPTCIIFIANGNVASGFIMLSAGIICLGLSMLAFYGSKKATKGIILLTKKITIWIKNCFIKKEKIK